MSYPTSSFVRNDQELQGGDSERVESPSVGIYNRPVTKCPGSQPSIPSRQRRNKNYLTEEGIDDVEECHRELRYDSRGEIDFTCRRRILFEESPSMTDLVREDSSPPPPEDIKVIYFRTDNNFDGDDYVEEEVEEEENDDELELENESEYCK